MGPSKLLPVLLGLALASAAPAQALTPLAPEGSYRNVCKRLKISERLSRKVSRKNQKPAARAKAHEAYISDLIILAFSSDTRLTFDGNDVDALLSYSELYLVTGDPKQVVGWRAEYKHLRRKYRC